MKKEIVIAGFGGQGILFSGKVLAYAGMIDGHNVSWLPSYGPEMRGGTANCSVIISDGQIGSPIVNEPEILIAMNLPSLDRFEAAAVPNGLVFIDSSLIGRKTERTDVTAFYIPATRLAGENNLGGLANIIMLGKAVREAGITSIETIKKAFEKAIPERKKDLLSKNIEALEIGYNS